ncbi:MAG: glutamate--tRNA ligase [Fimbriimonadaceae bacterium]
MSVRVRFAPSPTGLLHVGALRTVLFDYLFARGRGGVNILRIEDTDRTRYNPDSEAEFVETLRWVGIDFDEGPHIGGPHAPYRQSERKEAGIYAREIQKLLDNGSAYKAFDTSEELDEMRELQQINKMATGYFGGKWRDATPAEVADAEGEGKAYVIRLKIPRDKTIVLHDLIRGRVEWDSNVIDDPVLIKADGMPTYHFAAMVDDHLMGITHILRGEEWIPSAPKHIALFEAFGWTPPIFVHCPVIVGKDGKKLSKRHGATRVLDYAAQGFMPQSLKNFIALIGWSPGEDREVLTEEELISLFDLDRLQPSPGRFDLEKLQWLSGHAIRALPTEELLDKVIDFVAFDYAREFHQAEVSEEEGGSAEMEKRMARWASLELLAARAKMDRSFALQCVTLEQERVTTLADFGEACEFFLVDQPRMDPKAVEKWFGQPHVPKLFDAIVAHCESGQDCSVAGFEQLLRTFQTENEIDKLGPIVHPTRVALTGKTFGPGLFELMNVLGPARIVARIHSAKSLIGLN